MSRGTARHRRPIDRTAEAGPPVESLRTWFPPDGAPTQQTPLGAALLWRECLGRPEHRERLDALTWQPAVWSFGVVRRDLAGSRISSAVEYPGGDESAGVAYVAFVATPHGVTRSSAGLPKGASVPIRWLTLIRPGVLDWYVWGLTTGREPRPDPEQVFDW